MLDRSQGVETTSQIPPIRTPFDLQEALEEERYAIRALSELIKTARLSAFDSEWAEKGSLAYTIAQDLQFGLSKLLGICIDRQATIVDSYVDQYKDSDEYLLKHAETRLRMAEEGAFRPEGIKLELTKALGVTTVVVQRGGYLADAAKALETRIVDRLKKCQAGKGSKTHPATPPDPQDMEAAA